MCSRFELSPPARLVMGRFGLTVPPPWPSRPEIRPTDAAIVVGPDGGHLLRWGLEVDWDRRPLINARAETLAGKPTFKRLLGSRVLVPASAWWEWRLQPDGRTRARMRLEVADSDLFAFAGLREGERFTIVTCAAAPGIVQVHDRMPVVLPREAETAWLDPRRSFAEVAGLLCPATCPLAVQADSPPAPAPAQGDLFA